MRIHLLALAPLLLLACNSGGKLSEGSDTPTADADADTDADADADTDADADADTDADADADTDCNATVAVIDPAPAAADVPVDQVVTVTLDQAIQPTDPWSIELIGVSGSSALAGDGMSVSFTPDADLARETSYTVEAEVCGNFATTSFTTLPAPLPASDIEGRTYLIAFDELDISQPVNSALLSTCLPVDFVAVEIDEVDEMAGTMHAWGTTADSEKGGVEVSCGNAADAGTVDFANNPSFSMGPTTLTLAGPSNEPDIPVREFTLTGRFNADGTEILDVTVYALVDMTAEPGGVSCQFAAGLTNGTCLPCTVGATTDECLLLEATAPQGRAQPGLSITGTCFGPDSGDTGLGN